ncbi:ATP-grasp domain-containing protein [Halopseudomonas pachastrellae]|nr:ATP-grasp domain-containing protein [Halopseudomonas pachastrellae]
MQVAHRSHVISMLDGQALREVIEAEQPDYIVPEIEAIATPTLVELESEGYTVVPTAEAARLTMDREGIRRLAAETLELPTSPYRFADTLEDYRAAVAASARPVWVKPVMSRPARARVWYARSLTLTLPGSTLSPAAGLVGTRHRRGFVDFDYEITLLTVRHIDGTSFCEPIGHRQEAGDYRESWQPQAMSEAALAEAKRVASTITRRWAGRGVFGVELFVKGDQVWFSEVSPRPHDYRSGNADLAGPVGVCPARPRYFWACRSR